MSQSLRFAYQVYRNFWQCVSVCVAKMFLAYQGVSMCLRFSICCMNGFVQRHVLCYIFTGFVLPPFVGRIAIFKPRFFSKIAVCISVYLRNVSCVSIWISKVSGVYLWVLRYTLNPPPPNKVPPPNSVPPQIVYPPWLNKRFAKYCTPFSSHTSKRNTNKFRIRSQHHNTVAHLKKVVIVVCRFVYSKHAHKAYLQPHQHRSRMPLMWTGLHTYDEREGKGG